MFKNIFTITFILAVSQYAYSQGEVWSLERCILYAQDKNLTIQQSNLAVKQSELSLDFSKREYYPSFNGSVSYGFNVGRSIDPTTNDFVNNAIHTNGLSVNGGVTVYSGGRIPKTIEQNQLNIQAARKDLEQAKSDIGLQVAQAYLSILLAEEQLSNTAVSKKQLEDQLAQTEKLIKAGTLPANNRFDIEAQIATTEQSLVANQNAVDIAYLNLQLLLQLEPLTSFKIEKPQVTVPSADELEVLSLDQLYAMAEQNQPNIAAAELRTKSAEKGIEIAESALYPTVTVGGGLNTNYSNIGRDLANPVLTPKTDIVNADVTLNGVTAPVMIAFPGFDIEFPKLAYFGQLNQNFSGFVGLTANVPIYNKGQTKISIEQAKLNVISTSYQNSMLRQNLKSSIQLALADAKAAAKQLAATEKSIKAQEAAFDNTEKRFRLGAANSFEYNTARNNLESARNMYVLAKYDYIFKLKILDFYQGKPIQLN
jgi:outer membrane protein